MDIQEINSQLQIVKLDNARFRHQQGYVVVSGYTFKHPELGYVAFDCDNGKPYIPIGGRLALESILEQGGFVSFDRMSFVQEYTA